MFIAFALLLAVGCNAQEQAWIPWYTSQSEVETSSFETFSGTPTFSGIWNPQALPQFYSLAVLGPGLQSILGYNVTGIVNATTLTLAWAFRDLTTMPEVTFQTFVQTVTNGTALAVLTSPVITGPVISGCSNYTHGMWTWTPGSVDSYGNVVSAGDVLGIDMGLYFEGVPENINVTLAHRVTSPMLFIAFTDYGARKA